MIAPGHETRELVNLVREGRLAAVLDRASTMPAPDLADVFGGLTPTERAILLGAMPAAQAASVLIELPPVADRHHLLTTMDPVRAARLVDALQDDDATHLLTTLDPNVRNRIVARLDQHRALAERLRTHDPEAASAWMTVRLVAVGSTDTIALATESVRRQAATVPDLNEVWVVDPARRLVGMLTLAQLLLADSRQLVRDVMHQSPIHVRPDEDQRVVAQIVARYNLACVPVVDAAGRLLGRVTADDLRDVALDDAAVGLLRFGGVYSPDSGVPYWSAAVRGRLPSLYVNLFAAFGAAAVVYFFTGTVLRFVTLAVWMPVIAGVGGSAGTQALAAAIQRVAGRRGLPRGMVRAMAREIAIGICNGVAIGLVVGAVAVLLGEPWKLGLVVLTAMVANLAVASAVGAALPSILRATGRDPALASPVVVTAVTDACGFALLLGLANLLL